MAGIHSLAHSEPKLLTYAELPSVPFQSCVADTLFTSTPTLSPSSLEVGIVPQFKPRYNIAPSTNILIVRGNPGNGRTADLYRWGLIPGWAKDPIPASGYSEWLDPANQDTDKLKSFIVP